MRPLLATVLTLMLWAALAPQTVAQTVPDPASDITDAETPSDAGTPQGTAIQSDTPAADSASAPASAQSPQPVLQVTFDETEAIPGQPLTLRLTVLVPTFLPDPPVWPTLEAPNLWVRLPEGSTGPTSERIDGETWSGVTRRYLISPMIPGDFALPAQEVIVTWADPETNAPVKTRLTVEPLSFSGVLPDGAEGLDPFIAAEGLTLEQQIEGTPEAMVPGDSVARTVTATVEGTSPMFLPPLVAPVAVPGLRAYPDEPVLEESDNRGDLTGTRRERVVLVAEGGGQGSLPPVELRWYNLSSGSVETASVEGIDLSVDGPPAVSATPRDWRALALRAAALLLALALAAAIARLLAPRLAAAWHQARAAWQASEAHAWRSLSRAVSRRDHAALRPALDHWASRSPAPDPLGDPRVHAALTDLGAARYRGGEHTTPKAEASAWRALHRALHAARHATAHRPAANTTALPPLNPGT